MFAPVVVRVVVIGAGFGGLGVARALRRAGVEDVVVLERADSVGGVWRDNTYPGAACDVPSPLYSWSWAINPAWARRYSTQPEILGYIRRAAEAEGLLDLVRTGVEVTALEHVDGRWRILTNTGVLEADVVIPATGQLSNPVVPRLPGVDTFAGRRSTPRDGGTTWTSPASGSPWSAPARPRSSSCRASSTASRG